MKRIIILVVMMLLLTGCVNVDNASYSEIIEEVINSKKEIYNTYRNGYKFYLPHGLYIDETKEYNEEIRGNNTKYYLYIDIIGYLNKTKNNFTLNDLAFYSNAITYDEKEGFIEINQKDDKYLVEIMYNYAKIEVIVEEADLRTCVSNAIIILSSISYNDNILENYARENILSYNEESIDIFNVDTKTGNNYLKVIDEYEIEEEPDNPDRDLIK